MATSVLDIYNIALSLLSVNPLISEGDTSAEGNMCNLLWPSVRDSVLSDRMWSFATMRVALNSDPVASSPGNYSRFALPNDFIRIDRVTEDEGMDLPVEFLVEGQWILAEGLDVAYVKYLAQITDTTLYSQQFVQAVSTRLASEMAIPFVESRTLQEQLFRLYQYKLESASASDSQQGMNRTIVSNTLTSFR